MVQITPQSCSDSTVTHKPAAAPSATHTESSAGTTNMPVDDDDVPPPALESSLGTAAASNITITVPLPSDLPAVVPPAVKGAEPSALSASSSHASEASSTSSTDHLNAGCLDRTLFSLAHALGLDPWMLQAEGAQTVQDAQLQGMLVDTKRLVDLWQRGGDRRVDHAHLPSGSPAPANADSITTDRPAEMIAAPLTANPVRVGIAINTDSILTPAAAPLLLKPLDTSAAAVSGSSLSADALKITTEASTSPADASVAAAPPKISVVHVWPLNDPAVRRLAMPGAHTDIAPSAAAASLNASSTVSEAVTPSGDVSTAPVSSAAASVLVPVAPVVLSPVPVELASAVTVFGAPASVSSSVDSATTGPSALSLLTDRAAVPVVTPPAVAADSAAAATGSSDSVPSGGDITTSTAASADPQATSPAAPVDTVPGTSAVPPIESPLPPASPSDKVSTPVVSAPPAIVAALSKSAEQKLKKKSTLHDVELHTPVDQATVDPVSGELKRGPSAPPSVPADRPPLPRRRNEVPLRTDLPTPSVAVVAVPPTVNDTVSAVTTTTTGTVEVASPAAVSASPPSAVQSSDHAENAKPESTSNPPAVTAAVVPLDAQVPRNSPNVTSSAPHAV